MHFTCTVRTHCFTSTRGWIESRRFPFSFCSGRRRQANAPEPGKRTDPIPKRRTRQLVWKRTSPAVAGLGVRACVRASTVVEPGEGGLPSRLTHAEIRIDLQQVGVATVAIATLEPPPPPTLSASWPRGRGPYVHGGMHYRKYERTGHGRNEREPP